MGWIARWLDRDALQREPGRQRARIHQRFDLADDDGAEMRKEIHHVVA